MERERERERVCVCICVPVRACMCERVRERGRRAQGEREGGREYNYVIHHAASTQKELFNNGLTVVVVLQLRIHTHPVNHKAVTSRRNTSTQPSQSTQ